MEGVSRIHLRLGHPGVKRRIVLLWNSSVQSIQSKSWCVRWRHNAMTQRGSKACEIHTCTYDLFLQAVLVLSKAEFKRSEALSQEWKPLHWSASAEWHVTRFSVSCRGCVVFCFMHFLFHSSFYFIWVVPSFLRPVGLQKVNLCLKKIRFAESKKILKNSIIPLSW